MEKTDLNKQKIINSKIVAVYMTQTSVIKIISYVIQIPNISIILMLILLFLLLIVNRQLCIPKKKLYCYIIIAAGILFSSLLNGFSATSKYYLFYFSFGTVALLTSTLSIDVQITIKNMFIISFVRTLLYYIIQNNQMSLLANQAEIGIKNGYDSMQMGIAFEFTYIAILSLSITIYKKELNFNNKFRILALIVLVLAISVIIFDCWTRGAYLAFGIAAFLLVVRKLNYSKIPIIIAALLIVIILLNNLYEILKYVNIFLTNFGINIRVLTKQLTLFSVEDTTNGRDWLYALSWDMFKQSPIWGNGLGAFEIRSGAAYPHNIFLESMVEFGILGLVLMVYIYYSNFKLALLELNDEVTIYRVTIFFMSCLTLFTSGSFWTTPVFWLIFFSSIGIDNKSTYRVYKEINS